ncbi:uncharacterized protein LAESUDRAFT_667427, partial [Laetiporus sulphureus 93-53]
AAICYEHLNTLSDEVHLLWRGKLNISTAIFLANRYLLLFMAAAFILNSLVWATPLVIVSALRVYAINRRQWVLAVIALILGLAPVIVNIVNPISIRHSSLLTTLTGCSSVAIPTRLPPILSDMIVLLVTWFQTFHVVRDARKAGLKASLGALILRDGER